MTATAGEQQYVAAVDDDFCMGAAFCERAAPELFQLTPDGVSSWIGEVGHGREELEKIARQCPQSAIRVERLDGTSP
jgi:ferredoxin